MGQFISCTRSPAANEMRGRTIRIVESNGSANEYMPPLAANDVLQQYPHHSIHNAGDLQASNPRPVTPKEELLQGSVYFLVPLNTELQSDEQKIMGICDTPQLQMDYIHFLLTKSKSRSWRPMLGTIDESRFAF